MLIFTYRPQTSKLDEKLKRLTRMRLKDEIPKESYLELKKEIEQEKIELLRLAGSSIYSS